MDDPSPWCEAHHAIPWWVGGHSNLANGTFCARDITTWSTPTDTSPRSPQTGVIWDLTPDRMQTQPLHPDDPLTHGPGAPPDHAQTA
ncbi:hypothetical protein FGL98_07025 [Leekyejoonella antrihumi]|uniref:HNH endonuclease n=1 Tax=Leekyejoonella antrihumi TaxID=1660198 RepID=A0A563E4N0_9MICO|nr:hypothetical protein FGL98_07025 [Leekyejoonella antrihumi]